MIYKIVNGNSALNYTRIIQ